MPFELCPLSIFLEPTDNNKTFSQEVLAEMHNYLRDLPSYLWNSSTYVIFKTLKDTDLYAPQLLSKVNRGENDYLDPVST